MSTQNTIERKPKAHEVAGANMWPRWSIEEPKQGLTDAFQGTEARPP